MPLQLARLLQERVAPIFRAKDYEFHVQYIRSVRNWRQALPTVSALSGCFRKRNKHDELLIPHSFTFIQRRRFLVQSTLYNLQKMHHLDPFLSHIAGSNQTFPWPNLGMPSNLLEQAEQRLPRRFNQSGSDIFALVKAFVSDSMLSQPALLCLPGILSLSMWNQLWRSLQQEMHHEPYPELKVTFNVCPSLHYLVQILQNTCCCQGSAHFLEESRQADLIELAETLASEYPQYGRACRYLQTLGGQVARTVEDLPEIQFILAGGTPPVQRGVPALEHPEPYSVHRLNVTFHRYN